MLVSIIIPTFNREAYLPKAVESVITQSYKDWELLIIDDCSNDDTYFSVLPYLKDCRIKYFYLSKNKGSFGVSFARNYGIKMSKGNYISFLDSDDYWLPDKLEKQLNFLIKNNLFICQTEEIWIRNNKFVNPKKKHKKIGGDIFEKSLELCMVSPSAVMLHKSIFEKLGLFDESLIACEDYDLWLRISLFYHIGLLEEKLVVKRGGHDSQLSKTPALDKYRIYSMHKLLANYNLPENKKNKLMSVLRNKIKIYMSGCLKRNKLEEYNHYKNFLNKIID